MQNHDILRTFERLIPHERRSKRGDVYLRTLMIHGARSAILATQRRPGNTSWLAKLLDRRHPNMAAAALANKNARVVWALLAHDREYQPSYAAVA